MNIPTTLTYADCQRVSVRADRDAIFLVLESEHVQWRESSGYFHSLGGVGAGLGVMGLVKDATVAADVMNADAEQS